MQDILFGHVFLCRTLSACQTVHALIDSIDRQQKKCLQFHQSQRFFRHLFRLFSAQSSGAAVQDQYKRQCSQRRNDQRHPRIPPMRPAFFKYQQIRRQRQDCRKRDHLRHCRNAQPILVFQIILHFRLVLCKSAHLTAQFLYRRHRRREPQMQSAEQHRRQNQHSTDRRMERIIIHNLLLLL